jgi:MraZ protein
MFLGQYEHSVDEKGRLIVPAKYRESLGDNFIITFGLDTCLFVYPLEEWKNLSEKMKLLPLGQRDARAFKRILFSRATDCTMDNQGRVIIMKYLRDYAQINKEIMVIGVLDRIEIWSKDVWMYGKNILKKSKVHTKILPKEYTNKKDNLWQIPFTFLC